MLSIKDIGAPEILAIPTECPERLFAADPRQARSQYRELASRWHPDRCSDPQAHSVQAHLSLLYRSAEERRESGLWIQPGEARLHAVDGREFVLRFRAARSFALGHVLQGDTTVGFAVEKSHADLFERAVKRTRHFACADPRMAAEIERYLPRHAGVVECAQWDCLVLHKAPDLIRLADVLEHCGGTMDARHVAWIVSSLLSLACYLQFAGLSHGAISPESVWISPREHYCALLGDWWYATRFGQHLTALPARSLRFAPTTVERTRQADPRTDLELIRATARELLGDAGGSRLATLNAAPIAMIDWLRLPAGESAVEEYAHWRHHTLIEAFGRRRFVDLPLTADQVYPHTTH